jgi:hypothetical protein
VENFSNKIDEIHKQEIDLIIKRMKDCPKDFECVTIKFDNFCKVKDIGDVASIQCREAWSECKFRDISAENQFICRCPLRLYLRHKFEV